MIRASVADGVATNYTSRFGDRLKSVTSTFPAEAARMDYIYDGLGRRRNTWEGYPRGAPTWYCCEGPTRHCEEGVFD